MDEADVDYDREVLDYDQMFALLELQKNNPQFKSTFRDKYGCKIAYGQFMYAFIPQMFDVRIGIC